MKALVVFLSVWTVLGAEIAAVKQPVTAGPAESLAKQQASVRKQLNVDQATPADRFFATPWPRSAPLVAAPLSEAAEVPACEAMPAKEVDPLVAKAAAASGLKPELVRAVIEQESAYRPCAVSSKGAQGMMQLMPGTAQELGVQDPFDAAQNILGGAKYLKSLVEKYDGDLQLALSAYNAGPSKVVKGGGIPEIPETQNYVREIMKRLQ